MKNFRPSGCRDREESLLLLAVSRAASSDERMEEGLRGTAAAIVDESFRWKSYIGLARRHASLAAAYRFVADAGLEPRVPAEILQEMKLGYALAQATYIKNLIELRELAEGLEANGIQALVIKGIPLAARLYTDPAVRVSKDIDLLCRMADLPRAERLLASHGYSLYDGRLGREGYRRHHYHLVYSRGTSRESVVEVHWNVRHPGKGALIDTEPLFRHASTADIAGARVSALDDPRSLWQLAVNLSYNGFLEARDLGDLRRLALRLADEDWEAIAAFSRKTQTYNEFSAALAVAERAFGPFIPEAHRSGSRPTSGVRAMLLPMYTARAVAWRWVPFKGAQSLSVGLFMRQGLAKKLGYLYRIVVPDDASLAEVRSGLAPPKTWIRKLRFHANGVWVLLKVLAVSFVLGPLARIASPASGWNDPERHVDLTASRFPQHSR